MAKEQEAATPEESAGPKKSKTMLLVIIGVLVLLLGGGGFFAYTKLMAPKPVAETEKSGEVVPKKDSEVIGEIYAMAPFTVNLSDPTGKRYLKLKVEIEMESVEAVALAQKADPKLRDMVIMMLTSLSFEDVMTPEGKIRIRDELLARFNQIMRPTKVKNIYFTEFVVQ
ncbi:MAG: flagellar basal body-associated FliL family protein [Proteobacteria bacterium]|nr:flagellar basal body-associated FliL family protein [Pseudomonadota bacterium]MBU1716227.1 flagellar basal body-associated FliL family protein [Pseudomonadota bacterium]